MDREEQIDHLLDRWQQLREEGRPITPEELCREAPELLPSLRLRIEAVSRIEGLLGDPAPNATPPFRGRSSRETVIVGVAGPPQAPPGYELHSELGRGGVGVVYKAKQLGLKRLVALKMLLTGAHASAEDRRRFRREAETIARLDHPNIVQVYEIGEHEGRAFLALEFLDGGTLADRLREQPMPTPRAAELVRTLAVAVEAAHRASVVHRDLKPANVLMTAAGVPKISDFGLAKRLDDDRGRTGTGAILGTPAYMAPEQAEGRGATGPGVDVYALGAILYECLTGQVPFRAATMFELLDLVRHADPVPPTRLNDKIPRDLETVCLKCLEKDPARRYASAAALADDLRRYLAGEPILARPVGLVERGWRWSRRHRALAAVSAMAGLGVLALVAAGFWFSGRLGAARAEREASDARAVAAEAQALADRERAAAAERLRQAQRVFHLVTQAREQAARAEPGWRWRALDGLAGAARLPGAPLDELQAEAVAALGGLDLRLDQTVPGLPRAFSVAWRPGGRLLAVGERALGFWLNCNIHLVDLDRPEKRSRLSFPQKWGYTPERKPGPGIVRSLAFRPDGQRLAAGMRGGPLHVWDLTASPPALTTRPAHREAVEQVLFSADGRAIFTHDESTLKRWDAGKLVETASAPAATHRVAQHPTEGWLAVRDGATTRRLHPKTLRPAGPPLNTAGRLVAFSPCGRSLVVADGRSVWVWDVAGDRQAQRLRAPDEEYAHPSGVSDLALSPDGTLLATASDTTRSVRLWDLVSGRLLAEVPIGAGETRLAFDPRGASFAVLADDRALVYEVSRRHEQAVAARRPFPLQGLAMAADGPLACVSEGPQAGHGEVSFWAEPNPARAPDRGFAFAPADPGAAYPLALSADGRWLGVAGAGGRNLTLHDTRGEAGPKTAALTADTRSLAFAPDGRLWAAVGEEVRAWDVPSLEAAASWKNSLGLVVRGVSAMRAVSAGRRWVVAAGQDGIALVFPAGRGSLTPAASRELSRLPLRSVALSPDETLAVVGSDTGQRWLLRVPSAEVVAELPASGDAVEALAWAPNDLVASGCRNGKVTVYRREGDRLSELLTARHPRSLRGLSFDGRRLAVLLAGERGVRVWHLDRLRQRLVELGLGAGLEALVSQSSDPG